MIYITADHAGFKAKEALKKHLDNKKIEYHDLGPQKEKSTDDYPDFAHTAANMITLRSNDKGIFICGSGFGMAITANKHPGIRAAVAHSTKEARLARLHNDINVLCLSSRLQSQKEHKTITNTFLKTEFEGGRHKRRVKKIEI